MCLSMFDPKFEDGFALYIIWARPASGRMHSLAVGGLRAMLAAWEVVQQDCPTERTPSSTAPGFCTCARP